jgi:hypothetical protein
VTAFTSLPAAVRAAIKHGNTLTDIRPAAWASTYHCTTEDVKRAWEDALTAISQQPLNTWEVPDGK